MRRWKAIALAAGLGITAVLLWLVLKPAEIRSPEVRLESISPDDNVYRGFHEDLERAFGTRSMPWTATFIVRNPNQQAVVLDMGQILPGITILDRDSNVIKDNSNLALPILRSYLESNQTRYLTRLRLPVGSSACRFRVVYWTPTPREGWTRRASKSWLGKSYPAVVKWVSARLSDKVRTLESNQEIPLQGPKIKKPPPMKQIAAAAGAGWS